MQANRAVAVAATKTSSSRRGIANGYRSGLEETISEQIATVTGKPAAYETTVIRYSKPSSDHRYTPDFVLPNGIIVESKGRFLPDDRKKHLLIKQQHPDKDIRFVFSNPKARLSKTSLTTYAAWCDKYGFQWANKVVPVEWFKETLQCA